MKVRLIAVVVLVVLAANMATVLTSGAAATACDPTKIHGGLFAEFDSKYDGCDKHHILSAEALEATKAQTGIDANCGPVVNMPPSDHRKTPNWGSGTDGKVERTREIQEITDLGILGAFDAAAQRFIDKMIATNSPHVAQYRNAIAEARAALVDKLNNGAGPPPPVLVPAGTTNADDPPPPPAGGAVPVTANNPVIVSGSGLGTAQAGVEYDLLLADSAQLARDPSCRNSPHIISATGVAVDSSGNLPSASAVLGTFYWESTGEQDAMTPSLGDGQICFARRSYHAAAGTVPLAIKVYPAANTPTIYPAQQVTGSSRRGNWSVAVPVSAAQTTLSFCYGDGACVSNTIPSGSGSTMYSFTHVFASIGTYTQTARIIETGASAVPSTTTAGEEC